MIRFVSLSFALLFAAPANATVRAQVVLLNADTGVNTEKVLASVQKRTARPDAFFVEEQLPQETLAALQRHPYECEPRLPQAAKDDLSAMATDDGEVYVVLATTDHHKDVGMWRWNNKTKQLQVVNLKGFRDGVFPVQDTAAHVVNLAYGAHAPTELSDKALARMHRANPVVSASAGDHDLALVDELMAHPNECSPALSQSNRDTLRAQAAAVPEQEFYVAVSPPAERTTFLWRWNEQDGRLNRVLNMK